MQDTWWCNTEIFEATDRANERKVKDDTTCSPRKICINQSCIDITVSHKDCNLDKYQSHGRGVHRNFKNCHCIYVYSPPTCEFKGERGSLNSDPPTLSIMKSL